MIKFKKKDRRGVEMKKIDHIGIAVRSIEQALTFYTEILKLEHIKTEIVESEKVKVAFLKVGDCKLELLEPVSEESAIAKFIEKKGEGIHHVAFEVDDIHIKMEELKAEDIQFIQEVPKTGAGGALVAFMHPKSTGRVLYELCQKPKGDS